MDGAEVDVACAESAVRRPAMPQRDPACGADELQLGKRLVIRTPKLLCNCVVPGIRYGCLRRSARQWSRRDGVVSGGCA
ncbi:MAG TPA: hypothetical protein VEX40_06895, partial [Mycobacterium sp.]|nr:hypothetical protein [Mycobacterium sp.]